MKQEEKTNLIERYITGKLEDTELWEFKINLENDEELAREVEIYREMYSTISNDKKMELLKTLTSFNTNKQKRQFKINIYSRQVQALAASIIVLMMIGAGLLINYIGNSDVSNYNVYTEYFIDEGSLLTTRSNAETTNALVKSGIKLYNNGKYEQTISLFDSNPDNVIARLYSGFSYMNLKQFDMAENQFKYIINHGDNIFIDQAEWNLGLSYLADEKTEQAKTIFAKIASEDGAYSQQATNIIMKLKNR